MGLRTKTTKVKNQINGFIAAIQATRTDLHTEIQASEFVIIMDQCEGNNTFSFVLRQSESLLIFNYSTSKEEFTCSNIESNDKLSKDIQQFKAILKKEYLTEIEEALNEYLFFLVGLDYINKMIDEKLNLLKNKLT